MVVENWKFLFSIWSKLPITSLDPDLLQPVYLEIKPYKFLINILITFCCTRLLACGITAGATQIGYGTMCSDGLTNPSAAKYSTFILSTVQKCRYCFPASRTLKSTPMHWQCPTPFATHIPSSRSSFRGFYVPKLDSPMLHHSLTIILACLHKRQTDIGLQGRTDASWKETDGQMFTEGRRTQAYKGQLEAGLQGTDWYRFTRNRRT